MLARGGRCWLVPALNVHYCFVLARGRQCCVVLALDGHYWGCSGSWRALLGRARSWGHCWVVLARAAHCWVELARGGHCRVVLGCGGHY